MKILLFFSLFFYSTISLSEISDFNYDELYGPDSVLWQVVGGEKSVDRSIETFEGGFNDLISYVVPSPSQGNAGSCLFMAHTGVVEWWLNKMLAPAEPIMLSARYMMNLSSSGIGNDLIEKNWRTDTIFRVNAKGVYYANDSYRFTKNWFVDRGDRVRVPARAGQNGAQYGPMYNWIVELDSLINTEPDFVLPQFARRIIFADPEENQWNVNIAPEDIVEQVKEALETYRAPVIVMYNHYGIWHVSVVFGYNDYASSRGCPFISGFGPYKRLRAEQLREEALEAETEEERQRLLNRAARFEERGNLVEEAFIENGGCRGQGVFYVRDSIYPDPSMPLYDYDLSNEGEEEHLNAPLIFREYEWLERLSNHIIQIYPL